MDTTLKFPGSLTFSLKDDGTVTFSYREEESTPHCGGRTAIRYYRCSGDIPPSVYSQGEQVIKQYAWHKVREEVGRDKKRVLQKDRARRRAEAAVKTTHEGVLLKGKILWSEKEQWHVVRLESPGQGETLFSFGTGCGATNKIWEDDWTFTQKSIIWAENVLKRLYMGWKNRDRVRIIESLNLRKESQ